MKLHIINPPLHISNWAIKQGEKETHLSPPYVPSSNNNVYLTVNGQQIPLSPQNGQVFNSPYEFYYDLLNDYESAYQTVFDKVSVSQGQLDRAFWPGEMVEWFDQCEGIVYGQHIGPGNWRFAFTCHKDALLFNARLEQSRNFSFFMPCPSSMLLDQYEKLVFNWLTENVEGMWVVIRGAGGVNVEVRDQTQAVKAKMMLVEVHENNNSET